MPSEDRVIDAFCAYLAADGWSTIREAAHCDVLATRADERLYAEAKGSTQAPGLDADTMYGQLLRRMTNEHDPAVTRYAAVVPDEPTVLRAALRVPRRIRALLRIELYAVAAGGTVRQVEALNDA
ncbi:MAG: hypothetical protein ACRDP8_20260 [Actinopolymorphaceae bacterium]